MDLFSFLLGVGVTIGILYLIRCIQTNKKIRKHILGTPLPNGDHTQHS